jgi:uncharacterized membrane protein YphA (DoxX/SURF4 family)
MNAGKPLMQIEGMFFIRTLLGIIFFMQGFGKVFTIGIYHVYEMFFKVFETTFLPHWLIISSAYFTSYCELICGLLLIIGLFRHCVAYVLAADLLIVSFGHGLIEPIWDLSHVMPRAILLAALFLLPAEWDKWNLDFLVRNKIKKGREVKN